MLFYKTITAGNKIWIGAAKLNRLIDGRQRLGTKLNQTVHIDLHAFAGRFVAVADIVVGDDSGKIDQ